jgi:hypothetical protein
MRNILAEPERAPFLTQGNLLSRSSAVLSGLDYQCVAERALVIDIPGAETRGP